MKTKMRSYLEYFTGIVGKWPILQKNIQPRGCVGADLKSCMPGQWMPLVSHCRKVRHSHLQCSHWHFMAFYFLLYHNTNGKKHRLSQAFKHYTGWWTVIASIIWWDIRVLWYYDLCYRCGLQSWRRLGYQVSSPTGPLQECGQFPSTQ